MISWKKRIPPWSEQSMPKCFWKLQEAQALGLPDLEKPFKLQVPETWEIAVGVLIQMLGPLRWVIAYFSKQLDTVAQGWLHCLRAVAVQWMLMLKAEKLTMKKQLTI